MARKVSLVRSNISEVLDCRNGKSCADLARSITNLGFSNTDCISSLYRDRHLGKPTISIFTAKYLIFSEIRRKLSGTERAYSLKRRA
jgi:hypothetical protein